MSGAHFNPVVSIVDALLHRKGAAITAAYIPVQIVGCIAGAILANLMFAEPAVAWSTTDRATWPHLLAEVVATAGLVLVIFALVRTGRSHLAAPAVGAYIGAAYFFTSSTSFANPAITIGRAFTDTFAGIAPTSVLPFIGAQLIGAALGWLLVRALLPRRDRRTGGVRRLMTALPATADGAGRPRDRARRVLGAVRFWVLTSSLAVMSFGLYAVTPVRGQCENVRVR